MMMIIKNKIKNFWSIDQKFFSLATAIKAQLLFVTFIFLSCHDNNTLKVAAIKVDNGWGYTIKQDDKIIIKQTVIPAITNNHSFKSEDDALKTGSLVVQRLQQNSSPTITMSDLKTLAIKF